MLHSKTIHIFIIFEVKKVQDIFQNWEDFEEKLDISPSDYGSLQVSQRDALWEINDVYTSSRKKEQKVEIKKDKNIYVSQKEKWKNVDSLFQRKSFFSFVPYRSFLRWKWRTYYGYCCERFKKRDFLPIIRSGSFFSQRRLLLILGICVYIILSLSLVETSLNAGYKKLIALKTLSDIHDMQKTANNARLDFIVAQTFFYPYSFLPWKRTETITGAIWWGKHISRSIESLWNMTLTIQNWLTSQEQKLTDVLIAIYPELTSLQTELSQGLSFYEEISWFPSENIKNVFWEYITQIRQSADRLKILQENYWQFVKMLGHNERKRYLIVFQNADEIRPLWGFMWSMWFLEIFRWEQKLFQMKDVYAIEWDLKSANYERRNAPKGLDELTDTFWLRDANYFVSLEESSKAIDFFLREASISIDGIIYINHNILYDILDVSWEIYLENFDIPITKDNYASLLSFLVESKVSQSATLDTPKQAVFDLALELEKKIVQENLYLPILQSLLDQIYSGDMFVWMKESSDQKIITDIWLSWEKNYAASLDFLYPVFTSLSWNKSDRYISREYRTRVKRVKNSCDFWVRHTISQKHNMRRQDKEEFQSYAEVTGIAFTREMLTLQWASKNRQYVRTIVPVETDIREYDSAEVINYGTRKGIEFFIDTPEQGSSEFSFEYLLKNPECDPYSVTFFKQPWIKRYEVFLDIEGEEYEYNGISRDFYFEDRTYEQ